MKILLLGCLLALLVAGLPILMFYTPYLTSKYSLLAIGGTITITLYLASSIFNEKNNS
jgi:hypothetical protein